MTKDNNTPLQEDCSHDLERALAYEETGQYQEAIDVYCHILSLSSAHSEALIKLDKLYSHTDQFSELIDILKKRIENTDDKDILLNLYVRQGLIYSDVFQDFDEAQMSYNQALALDPSQPVALDGLEHLVFQRESWDSLIEIYKQKLSDASQDEEVFELCQRIGHLLLLTNQSLQSLEYWETAFEIESDNSEILENLTSIYVANEQWSQAIEILEKQIKQQSNEEEYMRHGIVALYLIDHYVDDFEQKNRIWNLILEKDKTNELVVLSMIRSYKKDKEWDKLKESICQLIQYYKDEDTHEKSIPFYLELGDLELNTFDNIKAAIVCWKQALTLGIINDDDRKKTIEKLEHATETQGDWKEYVDTLTCKIDLISESKDKIDHLLKLGVVCEERLFDIPQALVFYEQAKKERIVPSRTLDRKLESLYRAENNLEKTCELLLNSLNYITDNSERLAVYYDIAAIYNDQNNSDAQFLVLQTAFEEDLSNTKIPEMLESILLKTPSLNDHLLTFFQEQAKKSEQDNPYIAANLWYRSSLLCKDERNSHAISCLQEALKFNPSHKESLYLLASFQEDAENWNDVVKTYDHLALIESDINLQEQWYLKSAKIYVNKLQNVSKAIDLYQAVQKLNPTEVVLIELSNLYRQNELWKPLVALLKELIDISNETNIKKYVSEIIDIYVSKLNDASNALYVVQTYPVIDENDPAMNALLATLYKKTGDTSSYIICINKTIINTKDIHTKIKCYEELAEIFELQLQDKKEAIQCFEAILSLDGHHDKSFEGIIRLLKEENRYVDIVKIYQNKIHIVSDHTIKQSLYLTMADVYKNDIQDFEQTIQSYLAAFNYITQPQEKASLYCFVGCVYRDQLNKNTLAQTYFEQALSFVEDHVLAMESLLDIYETKKENHQVATILIRLSKVKERPEDYLYRAGCLYLGVLKNTKRATELFVETIKYDRGHLNATLSLATIYFGTLQWNEMIPLMNVLFQNFHVFNNDIQTQKQICIQGAKCFVELGQNDKALNYYQKAYQIDSTDYASLLNSANILYQKEDWTHAAHSYSILVESMNSIKDWPEAIDVFDKLGTIYSFLSQHKKAAIIIDQGLKQYPNNPKLLHNKINIETTLKNWNQVVIAKKLQLDACKDKKKQTEILFEIGNLYYDKINDNKKASMAYQQAINDGMSPTRELLQKLLDSYTAQEDWENVVVVLMDLAKISENKKYKIQYYNTAANICHKRNKNYDQAIQLFDMGLDLIFSSDKEISLEDKTSAMKIFSKLDHLLTLTKNYKLQERSYRKMIKRFKGESDILSHLWHALGEIYRTRLKYYQNAISAFEMAVMLEPKNKERNNILTELYMIAGHDYLDKMIAHQMNILKYDIENIDSYRVLRRLYTKLKQPDKAWCVCRTMTFLNIANDEERTFYETHKQSSIVQAHHAFNNTLWDLLSPSSKNNEINAIMTTISSTIGLMHAQSPKMHKINRSLRINLEQHSSLPMRAFLYSSRLLNIDMPDIYIKNEQKDPIIFSNIQDNGKLCPSFLLSDASLQHYDNREIICLAVKKLALMRPAYYLKLVFKSALESKVAFFSSLILINPHFSVPRDWAPLVVNYAKKLRLNMTSSVLNNLDIAVKQLFETYSEFDLDKWNHNIDLICERVAFFVCDDLVAAQSIMMNEPEEGQSSIKDRMNHLVIYSISEDYFSLRRELNITID